MAAEKTKGREVCYGPRLRVKSMQAKKNSTSILQYYIFTYLSLHSLDYSYYMSRVTFAGISITA